MRDLSMFGVDVGKGKHHEEAFYGLALVYTALFNKVSRYLDQYDLTPAKLNVLMVLKHQAGGKGLSQKDIGTRLMVTASNMTRLLAKLEREKLIEHSSRPGDKRVKVIQVSKRGSDVLDKVWPGYTRTVKDAMDVVSAADQKALAAAVLKIYYALTGEE